MKCVWRAFISLQTHLFKNAARRKPASGFPFPEAGIFLAVFDMKELACLPASFMIGYAWRGRAVIEHRER